MQSGGGHFTSITISPPSAGNTLAFFTGEQGLPSLRDVVDTINPLEHIPFVSTLFDQFTGHTPGAASKLVGGTLLGGPVGFVASLANVIFEHATGKDFGDTLVAALTDGDSTSTTQLASADAAYQTAAREVPGQEVLPPATAISEAAVAAQPFTLASAQGPVSLTDTKVLDLYGGSTSASRAYQRAQMRPYLQDVSQSMVL